MAQDAVPHEPTSGSAEAVALDAFDREIVELLTGDARLSIRAMARALGRSPGAVGERLNRLESSGVITGYYADIDYARLGYMHTLLGVQITDDDLVESCVDAISELPEVQRVWVVTGSWAVVAEAHVRDAVHLRDLLQVRMRSIVGVQHTEVMIVLDTATPRPIMTSESVPLPKPTGR